MEIFVSFVYHLSNFSNVFWTILDSGKERSYKECHSKKVQRDEFSVLVVLLKL